MRTWFNCALLGVKFATDLVLIALHEVSDHGPDHVQFLALLRRHRLAKVLQLKLSLLQLLTNLIDDVWQTVSDVSEEYTRQLRCENLATKVARSHGRVDWVRVEELHLLLHRRFHRDLVLDVLLGSVLDSNETQTELDLLIHDHTLGVGSSVHDVNFGDHTDCSDTFGVNSARHTKTFLGSHISVSSHDGEHDSSRVLHVPLGHTPRDLLDVLGLAFDGDQRDAWQIDQCQVWAGVRVYVEYDGVINDVCGCAANLISQGDNLVLHLLEVGEALALELLRELGPGLGALGLMVETEFEWAPGY